MGVRAEPKNIQEAVTAAVEYDSFEKKNKKPVYHMKTPENTQTSSGEKFGNSEITEILHIVKKSATQQEEYKRQTDSKFATMDVKITEMQKDMFYFSNELQKVKAQPVKSQLSDQG